MKTNHERCWVTSGPLNCGCCGTVEINCDLPAVPPHNAHEMTLDTPQGERIRWYYIDSRGNTK